MSKDMFGRGRLSAIAIKNGRTEHRTKWRPRRERKGNDASLPIAAPLMCIFFAARNKRKAAASSSRRNASANSINAQVHPQVWAKAEVTLKS